MPTHTHVSACWPIASPVAKQVHHDDAVTWRYKRRYLRPKVRRRGEAVQENDGLAGTATAGRVIVEPSAVHIDELTSHVEPRGETQGVAGARTLPRRSSSHGKMAEVTRHHKRTRAHT